LTRGHATFEQRRLRDDWIAAGVRHDAPVASLILS